MIIFKKKHLRRSITIVLLLLFIVSLFPAVRFINKYLSKVIISQPFSVVIEGISSENADAIKILGYSPTGKIQTLSNINEQHAWKYFDYSSFESLYIFIPDSIESFKKIVITTKNHSIEVTDFNNKISKNCIDLSESIKGRISKTEIVLSIFHWKEFKFIAIIVNAVLAFVFLILIFSKIFSMKLPYKIFWSVYVSGLLLHILFIVFLGKYLISSGIFFIVTIALLLLLVIIAYGRVRKLKVKLEGIRLSIISISIFLCLIEITFILTGFKSTYLEQINHYYYISPYIPGNIERYHIWSTDHDLVTKEFCFHRIINSEGLSDEGHNVVKKENEYRIIGLGDSFTEGDGTDADSTWLKFLERDLKKYPVHKSLTYINAGVCGSDPYFEYVLLKERLLKYRPDLVVLAVNCSDISDILLRGGMERFQPDGTLKYNPAPCWEPIYAISHISRLVFSAMGYNSILIKEDETEFQKSKENIVEILRSFKTLSEKEHFHLIMVFHPIKREINSNKLELKSVMEEVSLNNKIDVLNMLDYYKNIEKMVSTNSNEYFWKYDGHHNAKGYAAFARGVEWKLKQTGILDSLINK
jgi:lysophospholipase L1-like esterase